MSFSTDIPFEARPLLVLALGGNALSPPGHSADDYALERGIVLRTGQRLEKLISDGYRLLIVHGNGPQVGRLLRSDPERGNLDIHIAQTQGELGYLLADAIAEPMVCLLTRVIVDNDPGPPVKPIGPILSSRPHDSSVVRSGDGWRVIVPSPRPIKVVERDAIASLLGTHHVIAGGGGGVPITAQGARVSGVVDKDWVASLLAVQLDAQDLVFATDVDGVYEHVEQPDSGPVPHLSISVAREMIERGSVTAGSMAPKLSSAVEFVETTGRSARICHLDQVESAIAGSAGTTVGRDRQ